MKFQFKQQPYQADAVAAVVRVFAGQSCQEPPRYGLRPGGEAGLFGADGDGGFANRSVELSDEQLLANIQAVQCENGIHGSHALKRGLGPVQPGYRYGNRNGQDLCLYPHDV